MAIEMKICEYIHNFTNIEFAHSLVLNKNNPKTIEIHAHPDKSYYICCLLSVNPLNYYSTYTAMKVKTRNIKHPYLEFTEWLEHPGIWEAKVANIDIPKKIQLMFS